MGGLINFLDEACMRLETFRIWSTADCYWGRNEIENLLLVVIIMHPISRSRARLLHYACRYGSTSGVLPKLNTLGVSEWNVCMEFLATDTWLQDFRS